MIGIVRIPEPGDRNLYFFRNAIAVRSSG